MLLRRRDLEAVLLVHSYAPEKIEYGITRYTNETQRLYGV